MNIPINIEEYINSFPVDIQEKLTTLRNMIKEVVPNADETISYGMPTFKLKTNLVHFAAFKNHIGFYPTPSAIMAFKEKLISFKTSKGAIQFPINDPLPLELIKEIVLFRIKELEIG